MMTPEQEAIAKKRFMALNLVRLFALLLVIVGMLFVTDKIDVQPAHLIGVVFIVIGLVDFFVMPRILVKRWKTPEA
jgi:uncharacterized membrane protein YhaH (DUF805 family)